MEICCQCLFFPCWFDFYLVLQSLYVLGGMIGWGLRTQELHMRSTDEVSKYTKDHILGVIALNIIQVL